MNQANWHKQQKTTEKQTHNKLYTTNKTAPPPM